MDNARLAGIKRPDNRRGLALVLFSLIMLLAGTLRGQNQAVADSLVSRWARQELLKNASAGVQFLDALSGERLGSWNPELSLVPASTLKLVTTATALEMLGPDCRFSTRLAYSGTLRNDSLYGDLLVTGGGDPALGSAYFKDHYLKKHFLDSWIDSLKQHHIGYISGDLVTDATIFDNEAIPDTWIWEDIGNYFGAGVSGLSVYDNSLEIHLWSPPVAGQPTKIVSLVPPVPGLSFDNKVLSSNDQRDLAYVYGSPLDMNRVIRGTIPKGRNDFVIRASFPNPAQLLATQFGRRLAEAGIVLGGKIRESDKSRSNFVTLATTCSPPLKDLIRITNHESVNLFAEHLLRQLACVTTGRGTNAGGTRAITDFWKKQGIDTRGFFVCDGSGLSRFNALTAQQMTGILFYMKNKSRHSEAFFNSLPAVPDGTLSSFSAANFPNQSLRAKSGSMTRVRCYSGWLKTSSGRQILFSVALNNFSCTQAQAIDAIEKLLSDISQL